MKKLLLLLLASLSIIAGCKKEKSQDVDPDFIQQDIRMWYDADNLDQYFGIRFYDAQWYKRVILASPASVKVNGSVMALDSLNSFYELKINNQKVDTGLFVYTDTWNRVYKNTVFNQKPIELPKIDTLYTYKDNVITWIGDPCAGAPEVITFSQGIIIKSLSSTSEKGATSITVSKGSIAGLKSGGWSTIRIERKNSAPLQQGTKSGGSITSTYYSKIKWVYIK